MWTLSEISNLQGLGKDLQMRQAAQNDRPGTFPLLGMRVVSFENPLVAPICTRHLADLGLEAVMSERPGVGDIPLGFDTFVYAMLTYFLWPNRGKSILAMDAKADSSHATQDGTVIFSIQQERECQTFCEPVTAQPEIVLHEDDRTKSLRIANTFGNTPTMICAHP